MDTTAFFETVFGSDLEGGHILVWIGGEKVSKWFDSPKAAGAFAQKITDKDVYFGLGLSPEDFGTKRRCPMDKILAIPGLWADIDYAHDVHQKANLPPTKEDAISFLSGALPPYLKPSLIVHTGHGLQAYWLFNELWTFESETERQDAQALVRGFIYTLQSHAATRGWTVDPTFDLARVFRVVGTNNCKADPIPVEIIETTTNRFNPDDFTEILVEVPENYEESVCSMLSDDKNPLNLIISAEAAPAFERMETMKEVNSAFAKSWEMNRKDFADQSLSAYEMSLANMAVEYDWPVQQIANLLIAFRRRHATTDKQFHKVLRLDYLNRTILKAQQAFGHSEASEQLDDMHLQLARHREDPESPKPKSSTIRDKLQIVLNVKIKRLIKYLGDEPTYEMELENDQKIMLGPISNLINQQNLRNKLAAHCGILLPRYKPHVWDKYCELMLAACDQIDPGKEVTDTGNMYAFLKIYLDNVQFARDWKSALAERRPYIKDGHTFIFGPEFRNWLKLNGEVVSAKQLGLVLARLGAPYKAQKFMHGPEGREKWKSVGVYDVSFAAEDHGPVPGGVSFAHKVVKFPGKGEESASELPEIQENERGGQG